MPWGRFPSTAIAPSKSFFVNDINDMVYMTNPELRASASVEPGNQNLTLSARNLPRCKTSLSTALNVVDLLRFDTVVLSEAAARRVAEVLQS